MPLYCKWTLIMMPSLSLAGYGILSSSSGILCYFYFFWSSLYVWVKSWFYHYFYWCGDANSIFIQLFLCTLQTFFFNFIIYGYSILIEIGTKKDFFLISTAQVTWTWGLNLCPFVYSAYLTTFLELNSSNYVALS